MDIYRSYAVCRYGKVVAVNPFLNLWQIMNAILQIGNIRLRQGKPLIQVAQLVHSRRAPSLPFRTLWPWPCIVSSSPGNSQLQPWGRGASGAFLSGGLFCLLGAQLELVGEAPVNAHRLGRSSPGQSSYTHRAGPWPAKAAYRTQNQACSCSGALGFREAGPYLLSLRRAPHTVLGEFTPCSLSAS